MISIIIPAYNHASELPKTLDAIFAQDEKDIEVIVVNDGSSDNTEQAIKPYLEKITYIAQENAGAPVARNKGFKRSKGEYVIFCDADLQMHHDMLTKLKEALETHSEASFAYGSFMWGRRKFESKPWNPSTLREVNYIHTSALIRRKDFPGFDESLKKFQDWDLWLTMAERKKRGVFVEGLLCYIEPRKEGISSWLPSVVYKIPWHWLGIHIKELEKYNHWKAVVQKKHGIDK